MLQRLCTLNVAPTHRASQLVKPLQGTVFLAPGPVHAAFELLLHMLQSWPAEPQQSALTAGLVVARQPTAGLCRAIFNGFQAVSTCSVCPPARVHEIQLRLCVHHVLQAGEQASKQASIRNAVGACSLAMHSWLQRCCFRDPCVSPVAAPV